MSRALRLTTLPSCPAAIDSLETFSPLDPQQRDRLAAELGGLSGQQVILETKVNPDILGGIIVTYRDKILDRSIRRGFKDLSETLKSGV